MKKAWLERAALAAIIIGIITGQKVLDGAINLRIYTFVVMAVFVFRLEYIAGIISKNTRLWLFLFLFLLAGLASMLEALNLEMGIKQIVLISTFMLVPLAMTALIIKRPENIFVSSWWLIFGTFIANVNGYIDPFYRFRAMGWVTNFGRPQSFFTESNEYGQFMVMAWGYLLAMSTLRSATPRMRKIGLWSGLLMFPVFLINNSRGSYLGFALECLLVGWLLFKDGSSRYFLKVASIGTAIFVGALLLTYSIANMVPTAFGTTVAELVIDRFVNFGNSEDKTTQMRADQQRSGYQALLEHPWTGAGLGNIMYYLNDRIELENSGVQKGPMATTAFWLTDLLGETGIFGTLAMGLVIFVLIQQGYRNHAYFRGSRLECFATGCFLSFPGMILNGVSYPPIYLSFFWLNVGLSAQLSYLRETGARFDRDPGPRGFC